MNDTIKRVLSLAIVLGENKIQGSPDGALKQNFVFYRDSDILTRIFDGDVGLEKLYVLLNLLLNILRT